MALKQLSLVTIQVRDFDGMVAWYRDVLGLAVGWVEPGEFCMLNSPGGGASVALATDHPDRITETPGKGWAPTFAVEDLDAFVAHLRASGAQFDADEEGAEEDYRLVRVRDPEGNPIGLSA
jgi:catechol 2,3-dioxygenase-like lactoylglutathione lyase family enzyme